MTRKLHALIMALALALSGVSPAMAQSGGTDYDGNGVTDARDLVSFVARWVIDAGLSVTPTAVPPTATAAPSSTATRTATPVPATVTRTSTPQPVTAQRMIVVVLENRNLTDVQVEPYFASLAARGRLLTNYLTIANPSQPNYVAMNFGDTMGVTDNSPVDIPGRNIVDLLEEAGVSWRTYHEDYPGNCSPVERAGGASGIDYARKHNAFISSDTVRNNADRCAKIVDALAFEADIAAGTVPRYSVFVPDKDNSSHDTSIPFAAAWLQGWLEPKLANPSLADVLWVITWDEGEDNGSVPISTILIGPGITPGTTDGAAYTHYSLLRTTQQFFGLGSLGRNDATAPLIPLGGAPVATGTPSSVPTVTATPTRTPTFLPVITNTATRTATATRTPTRTLTPTVTRTPTRTPTVTRTPGGPVAFGDVSVIDTFTGADGALPASWTTDAVNDAANAPRIASNQIAGESGGNYSSARRNDVSYSGDKQAYITISALPEASRYVEIGFVYNPGASADAYSVEYRTGTGVRLARYDNTVETILGAAVAWSPSAGDKLGIRVDETNGVIEAWTYSGGSWSQLFTRTDSTYTGTGYPFVYIRGTSTRGDDFAAGPETVATALVDMIDSSGVIAFAR